MIEKRKSADYKKGFCEGYESGSKEGKMEGRREVIEAIVLTVLGAISIAGIFLILAKC